MTRLLVFSATAIFCTFFSTQAIAQEQMASLQGTLHQSADALLMNTPRQVDPGFIPLSAQLMDRFESQSIKVMRDEILEENKRKSNDYHDIIVRHANENKVPLALAKAVIKIESNFRPNALGGVGEIGLMQLRFNTARLMGYKGNKHDLYHPETNIKYGMKYLGKAHRLASGKLCRTILKYNAGHNAKRMNPISANYCRKVKRVLAKAH